MSLLTKLGVCLGPWCKKSYVVKLCVLNGVKSFYRSLFWFPLCSIRDILCCQLMTLLYVFCACTGILEFQNVASLTIPGLPEVDSKLVRSLATNQLALASTWEVLGQGGNWSEFVYACNVVLLIHFFLMLPLGSG